MPYAIIRRKNGRRHEVDFGDEAVRVEIHSSEETVEIFIEADFETLPEGRRRFAILTFRGTCLARPPQRRRVAPRSPLLRDFGNFTEGDRSHEHEREQAVVLTAALL